MKTMIPNSLDILESYIKGKDEDQYEILETIYTDDAQLAFEITSNDISFPENITGNKEIARVLSKDFNKKYSSVKTYCLSKPKTDRLQICHQKWLVVMRDISNESNDNLTRVGCGYYDWNLTHIEGHLKIQKHKIYIHAMLQLQDEHAQELHRIQSVLIYPWADKESVISVLNTNSSYSDIVNFLADK